MDCPKCNAPGEDLSIRPALVAKPLGSFSLPGTQPKVSAVAAYKISCPCGWHVFGQIHGNTFVAYAEPGQGEGDEPASDTPES